jgi:hypothetical protein
MNNMEPTKKMGMNPGYLEGQSVPMRSAGERGLRKCYL